MISWATIVVYLLKIANAIFSWAHENQLIQAGEDRQVARELVEMAKRSTTIKLVDERFAKITPEDVNRELANDFRD